VSGHERERLSAYLDRELPPGERAAVEAHLAACPECAAFLAELAAVDAASASLPAEAPEGYFESFPGRVRARLEARKRALPARRVPVWTWAAAAAVLLAVVTPLTLRQLRSPSVAAPATVHTTPPAAAAKAVSSALEVPRPAEPSPAARTARPASSEKRGAAPAAEPAAPPAAVPAETQAPAAALSPQGSPVAAAKDEVMAEGVFAREPAAPPVGGGVAREAEASREKSARDRLRLPAARAATESASPALSAATAGAAAEISDAREHEDAFRRLESVRPRSAAEWRRLRDQWSALAAVEADSPRADEARVRAIVAAREAWRAGGDEADAAGFRREAEAYLRREDARQKPRVEALLAEP
jgi:hypothetical protein